MAGALASLRDYARSHPMSLAVGVVVAVPGAYLYVTGQSVSCAVGLYGDASSSSSPQSYMASIASSLMVLETRYPLDIRLSLPTSRWSDGPDSMFVLGVVEETRNRIRSSLAALSEGLGVDLVYGVRLLEDRWATPFPFSRFMSVAITTALPGAFLVLVRRFPRSWPARHRTHVANTLHVLALVTVASQRLSVQDLVVTTIVMVSLEALQRTLDHADRDPPSAVETLLSQTHSAIAQSDLAAPLSSGHMNGAIGNGSNGSSGSRPPSHQAGSKDEEIVRLQQTLTAVSTADKAKEHDLRRTQNELQNARTTLNETFAEYASLRDEMKAMKQSIGRDHQAVIYRKDIELFALRKANDQKETYIRERDAKLDDAYRQQKATLELKDAQLRNLKERVAFLEQQSPRFPSETKVEASVDGDHQAALQVKLLRVKGRNSLEVQPNEEKDQEIARMKEELAEARKTSRALAKTQDELRRAWDASYEVQHSLNEERQQHADTQERLEEAFGALEEERKKNVKYSPTRLPTIEEQDKKELEAMFDATQKDNLRLYSEVQALDKRLRESNARLFSREKELEALHEQLRLEKAITQDMEQARPSLVHRVHFQRMEGQLKETRDLLLAKEDEIKQLKQSISTKENSNGDLKKEKENSAMAKNQLQEENERLKKYVQELESTKEQLMLDHERLAQHRARQRNSSAEHTSARSSGATLISDPNNHPITNSDEPMPARPVSLRANSARVATRNSDEPAPTRPLSIPTPQQVARPEVSPSPERPAPARANSSIQNTPERIVRIDPTPMISHDLPPSELRPHRKSGTLKNFFRKLAGEKPAEKPAKISKKVKNEKEKNRPSTTLASKDNNTRARPKSSGTVLEPVLKGGNEQRPKSAALPRDMPTLRMVDPTPTREQEQEIFPTPKREVPQSARDSLVPSNQGTENDGQDANEEAMKKTDSKDEVEEAAYRREMSPASYAKPAPEVPAANNGAVAKDLKSPAGSRNSPARYYASPAADGKKRSVSDVQSRFKEDRSVSTGSTPRPESIGFSRRLLRKSIA